MTWMQGPGGGDTRRLLGRPVRVLRGAPRRTKATRVAEEPAWSGSLRGGPMSSWAPPEPGPRVWTNGRFRNVGCAVQPSSDKKGRRESRRPRAAETLRHTGKRSSYQLPQTFSIIGGKMYPKC